MSELPKGGETNVGEPSRFELTEENVKNAYDLAKRSTPGLRWGPAPYEPGDMEKLMAKSGGPAVYCAWTGPKEDEVYAALTGNGPTSEVNALFFAHARDIVIELIDERHRLRAAAKKAVESLTYDDDDGAAAKALLVSALGSGDGGSGA
jgi:hypothetical protein